MRTAYGDGEARGATSQLELQARGERSGRAEKDRRALDRDRGPGGVGTDCTGLRWRVGGSLGTPRGAVVYKFGTIMKNTQTLAPQKVALRFSASERGSPVRFVSFRRKVFTSGRRVLSERSSTLGSASAVVSVRHRSPVTTVFRYHRVLHLPLGTPETPSTVTYLVSS